MGEGLFNKQANIGRGCFSAMVKEAIGRKVALQLSKKCLKKVMFENFWRHYDELLKYIRS